MNKKIIFIGGFFGTKFDHLLFKKILSDYELIIFQYDTRLLESIEVLSRKLKSFIDLLKLRKNEKIIIIGLSAGGIVAEYYLKKLDSSKCDKFVSIYSPFKGSFLSYLFPKKFKGLMDLKPNTELLKKLQSLKLKNIKILSFWCFFDPIVAGMSGKYINSKHCFFFIHSFIQFWPFLIYRIKRFLH